MGRAAGAVGRWGKHGGLLLRPRLSAPAAACTPGPKGPLSSLFSDRRGATSILHPTNLSALPLDGIPGVSRNPTARLHGRYSANSSLDHTFETYSWIFKGANSSPRDCGVCTSPFSRLAVHLPLMRKACPRGRWVPPWGRCRPGPATARELCRRGPNRMGAGRAVDRATNTDGLLLSQAPMMPPETPPEFGSTCFFWGLS